MSGLDIDAAIKILDLSLAGVNARLRLRGMLQQARDEGRTVTLEEVQTLIEQSDELRDDWNNGVMKK